jgi:hypothetical protein
MMYLLLRLRVEILLVPNNKSRLFGNFRGGYPDLGLVALESNLISVVVFIHFHSIKIKRHMVVTWKSVMEIWCVTFPNCSP